MQHTDYRFPTLFFCPSDSTNRPVITCGNSIHIATRNHNSCHNSLHPHVHTRWPATSWLRHNTTHTSVVITPWVHAQVGACSSGCMLKCSYRSVYLLVSQCVSVSVCESVIGFLGSNSKSGQVGSHSSTQSNDSINLTTMLS